jgi:hypothetical protein
MNASIHFKTTTLSFLIASALASFGLLPKGHATDLGSVLPNANTADGSGVLINLTPGVNGGINNSGFGFQALNKNTDGINNTATGSQALFSNEGGDDNTANGAYALHSNTGGNFNTATGFFALEDNETGSDNTATGVDALASNTTGGFNTAHGVGALGGNTTGSNNTASGYNALAVNNGSGNTANGVAALGINTTGDNNTATGLNALLHNTEGVDNTATGLDALLNNKTGNDNTANGPNALQTNVTGNDNTADGHDALLNNTTGSENIAVGHGAGQQLTTGDYNIDIGNSGVAGEANTIRIGHPGFFVEPGVLVGGQTKTFIAGINGAAIGGGAAVRINANGQLGTAPSSQRFKDEIKPMAKASEAILALKPVTFRYKQEIDPARSPQFGLVAEEVAKVNPDLVTRDAKGELYTVRYEAVNAMLLNEFLKAYLKIEQQEAAIAKQQKQIEALTTGLQKVSAQLEVNKAAPQTVANNQ